MYLPRNRHLDPGRMFPCTVLSDFRAWRKPGTQKKRRHTLDLLAVLAAFRALFLQLVEALVLELDGERSVDEFVRLQAARTCQSAAGYVRGCKSTTEYWLTGECATSGLRFSDRRPTW